MCVALYWIIEAVAVRNTLLSDPDVWWHVKTGAWIWQHAGFPATDPFSYTYAGHPWIAKEWLSQVIFFGAYEAGGWNGVLILGALCLGLAAALLYTALSNWLYPSLAAIMTLLVMFLASPAISIRPHLLSMPLMVLWGFAIFRASARGTAPGYLWLLVLVLWANLHAAFTMGLVFAVFGFLDFAEVTRLGNRRELARWLGFLALCPIVTLIHPYGYKAMMMTLLVVMPNASVPLIDEWQPFNAQVDVVNLLSLLALLFAALGAGFRMGFARALLLTVLLYLYLTHVRYMIFLFPMIALLAAAPLAVQYPGLSAAQWRSRPPSRADRFMGVHFKALCTSLISILLVVLFVEMRVLKTAPNEQVALTDAIQYAKSNGLTGRVMNFYDFGGPLIFHDIPTFIDGRAEQLFLGDFIKTYAWGPDTETALAATLRQYDVSWTIMPPGDRRVALLDKLSGWKRVFADKNAVIHQRQ